MGEKKKERKINANSYLHHHLRKTRIYSLFPLRSNNVHRHTATALDVILCWVLLFVHELSEHSLSPSFDHQHPLAMPLCISDRLKVKQLVMFDDWQSNRQPDLKWCITMPNRMMQRLMWAIFDSIIYYVLAIQSENYPFNSTCRTVDIGYTLYGIAYLHRYR